jgi:hypothetical protein
MYITMIMITQANKCVGWPPPIPLNYERLRTRLVMNTGARGSVAIIPFYKSHFFILTNFHYFGGCI